MTWQQLKLHSNYEIFSEPPYQIKKKSTGNIVKDTLIQKTYYRCKINGTYYMKSRVVANQFLDFDINDKNLVVCHIDGDHKNNSLANLRVTSRKGSQANRSGSNGIVYEYIDKLPDDSLQVTHYNQHTFDNLFFHDNNFYLSIGDRYRKVPISKRKYSKDGPDTLYISAKTVAGECCKLFMTKFKKMYNLV